MSGKNYSKGIFIRDKIRKVKTKKVKKKNNYHN